VRPAPRIVPDPPAAPTRAPAPAAKRGWFRRFLSSPAGIVTAIAGGVVVVQSARAAKRERTLIDLLAKERENP